VIGFLLAAATVAGFITLAVVGWETTRVTVDYADLQAGRLLPADTTAEVRNLRVTLIGVPDSAEVFPLVLPQEDKELVAFELMLANDSGHSRRINEDDFKLKDSDGDWHDPLAVVAGGRFPTVSFPDDTTISVFALFEIPDDSEPESLKYSAHLLEGKQLVYEFE
jgi:hypothetical protein